MRAFIAIELPDRLKQELHEYRNSFRSRALKGRWRHSDNFHLTLKFFNEISKEERNELDVLMSEACRAIEPFRLRAGELGVFTGGNTIRTLWIGLDGDLATLKRLYEIVEIKAEAVGFPKEKRGFNPHITLGQNIEFEAPFEELKKTVEQPRFHEIPVDRLCLFKSEQIGGKRVYTKVSEYFLDRG